MNQSDETSLPGASRDVTTTHCPMCGQWVEPATRQCPACGEPLAAAAGLSGGLQPAPVDFCDALIRAWRLMRRRFGLVFGAFVLMVANIYVLRVIIPAILDLFVYRGQIPLVHSLGTTIVLCVVQPWVFLGYVQILLNVATGKKATIGMMYGKGDRLLSFIGAAIIVGVAMAVASLVPLIGIYFVFIISQPLPFILVDQKLGPVASVRKSFVLAWNHFFTLFFVSIFIVSFCIAGMGFLFFSGSVARYFVHTITFLFGGFIFVIIGLSVTLPFVLLTQAIVYAMMTGQPVDGEAA